jgi:hypothetical protein
MMWYAPVHTFNPSRQSYYTSLQLCNPFCSNPFNYLIHCFRHCWSGTRHYWGSVGHFDPGFLFRVQAFRSDLSWPSNDYVRMVPLSGSFLNTSPVDILLLGDLDTRRDTDWLQRVAHAQQPPRLVLESWNEEALLSEAGPVSKKLVTEWQVASRHAPC